MEPPRDTKMDVSGSRSRYFSDYVPDLAYNFPGYRTIVHVPFDGDPAVFRLRTSSFSTVRPRGEVGTDALILTIDYPHDHAPNVDGETRNFVELVSKYLGWAREELGEHVATGGSDVPRHPTRCAGRPSHDFACPKELQ